MGKIINSKQELKRIVKKIKEKGNIVVFTNGCFDILHIGHITYLKQCKDMGDVLFLGLNSDISVKKIKGKERPIVPVKERAEIVAELESVDYVYVFDEINPACLIDILKPDILVKGGDYKEYQIAGAGIVENYGGKVKSIPLVKNKSTSRILQKIKKIKSI